MMGLQRDEVAARAALAQAQAPAPAVDPAPPVAPREVAPSPAAASADPVALRPRSGTMIGVAAPVPTPAAAPFAPPSQAYIAPQGPGPASPPPPVAHRREAPPILGTAAANPVGPSAGPFVPRGPGYDSVDLQVPGLGQRKPSGVGRALGIGVLVFGVLALGGYGVTRYLRPASATLPSIGAEVRSGADGALQLVVQMEGLAAGTRARRGTAEAPFGTDGRATLPLVLGPSDVGTLSLPVEVVPPTGAARPHLAQVLVAYRVEPDLRMLGEETARVHLRFRVPPGAQLFVAGQAVTVAEGLGIAEIPGPAPADADSPHRSTFPVRVVTAEGRTVEGAYTLRLPRIPLRIVEPGRLALVRAATATVVGTAQGATRVRVGAVDVDVTNGQFRAEVPVPPGTLEVPVIARGPGGAATQTTLRLLRDVPEAQFLGPDDPGVTALVTPGFPAGRRLSLRGRVLDTRTATPDAPPTFQLLVTDRRCPQGRCVVWVDVPHGTVVATQENVRVVGETAGTRAYTNAANERRDDPVVLALTVTR